MPGEEELPLITQLSPDDFGNPQLFFQPDGDRLGEGEHAAGKRRQVSREEALELQERFVVEAHVVQVGDLHSTFEQAVADGLGGKVRVVLLASEAFLRGGRDDSAVLDQAGGRVMVETGDPENVQSRILLRTAERNLPASLADSIGVSRKCRHAEETSWDPCAGAA